MAQLTPDRLEGMLSEYGWTFSPAGPNTWRTGFKGTLRLFPLYIRLTQTCVSFEVRPLIESKLDIFSCQNLSRDLLELNERLQLVKVAVDSGGAVSLSCQVLAMGFDSETLNRVLGIIGYYADEVAPEIHHRLAALGDEVGPGWLS